MLAVLACLLPVANVHTQEEAAPVDADFRPVFVGMELSTDTIRPGDRFAVEFHFRNDGTKPGLREHRVFLHFEHPEASCENIRFAFDHEPAISTVRWEPGKLVHDGPYAIPVPTDASPGQYHIHVGVFDAGGDGHRLCDDYVGTLTVDPSAEKHSPRQDPLPDDEAAARREALEQRLRDPLRMDGGAFELRVSEETGTYEILDKRTKVVWPSNPAAEGIGEVSLASDAQTVVLPLDSVDRVDSAAQAITLHYRLKPAPDDEVAVRVKLERVGGPDGLKVSLEADAHDEWEVTGCQLLDDALFVTNNEAGQLVIPHRLGILMQADGGLPDTRSFRAYANANAYSMAFAGAVKSGSAIMVTWEDPYTVLETRGAWVDHELVPGSQSLSLSLKQTRSARSFTIYPLGAGDYVHIGKSYRLIAKKRGLLTTWADKAKENPGVERMFGAADFKPFVFVRVVPHTRGNDTDQERLHIGYTFEEAAQIAEHLRNDLGIERAMYVLAGWIHRGYDNQHPDILPAAPECGGDEALADCSERVRKCGYLFGLHDNYQDMYEDSPSWDETYIMENRDGSLHRGGQWAGGQAYLTCSRKALELAKRPQSLVEVRRLFRPSIYFIDTTYAAPPYECHHPDHPLSLSDDIYWKNELAKYARDVFGLFGSEEGQEWAVPDADYFEGLMSHKTGHSGQEVIPLFEIVYGDCINLYTHQGDRASPARAAYILDHILYAENPVYAFGQHLYFGSGDEAAGLPVRPEVAQVKQTGPRTFDITYRWRVAGPIDHLPRIFVHFTSPQAERPEAILFQDDHLPPTPTDSWQTGDVVDIGPHSVEIPEGRQGDFAVLIGMLDEAGARQQFRGLTGSGGRFCLGHVTLRDGKVGFRPDDPSIPPATNRFARGDGGWAEGLMETDRFIKNTHEVLSPLNVLTAHLPMTDHEFVSATPRVERSRFGDDVDIIVNYGPGPYDHGGVELPEYGFLVRSPTFWAFHATRFGQIEYDPSAMFVVQSLGTRPITDSETVRVYHAFGDSRLDIGGNVFTVEREAEVPVRGG